MGIAVVDRGDPRVGEHPFGLHGSGHADRVVETRRADARRFPRGVGPVYRPYSIRKRSTDGTGGGHVELDEAVHLDRVFHGKLFHQRFDEPGDNHR